MGSQKSVNQLVQASRQFFSNPLGEFTYFRTYSRWMPDEGRRETWIETVNRYMQFMRAHLGSRLTESEYHEIYIAILCQEVMPSMRLMWAAGPAADRSNFTAYNCSYLAPECTKDFADIIYILMCGTGVGFSVESRSVNRLPVVQPFTTKNEGKWVVEDSKEGWANAFKAGMDRWFKGVDIEFDYSKLRPKGARLLTMGGRSSGPEPLIRLIDFTREVMRNAGGRKLRPIEVHDIVCKIGEIVVSGGVRRSSLISLSDLHDEEMRRAKPADFYTTAPHRAQANNSAVYNEKPDWSHFQQEWEQLAHSGTGERGIFARNYLAIPERRKESVGNDFGVNPCVPDNTWVMTDAGAQQVKDLIGKPFVALVGGGRYDSDGFFQTGIKPLVTVTTEQGFTLSLTSNHRLKRADGSWQEAGALQPGEKIVLNNNRGASWGGNGTADEGWLIGSLIGDGTFSDKTAYLQYWGESAEAMCRGAAKTLNTVFENRCDLKGGKVADEKWSVSSIKLREYAKTLGIEQNKKTPTEAIEKCSSAFYEGFLQGWFDADGSVQGSQEKGVSIRLSSSSEKSLEAAQRMLARLGIVSKLYRVRREAQMRPMPDGNGGEKDYWCQSQHELIIANQDLQYYADRIGFRETKKHNRLHGLLAQYKRQMNQTKFFATVETVTPSPTAVPVFDCTVNDVHAFDANGFYAHNCGEIFLRNRGLCNLSEVYCRPTDTKADIKRKHRIATILGTFQSMLTHFPYTAREWAWNAQEERLLGVSLTGQWDCPTVQDPVLLRELKEACIAINKVYAAKFGVNPSMATTCVKPNGNGSQTFDSSSGMHPRHAPYYMRRIRISATEPLFHMMRDAGWPYHPENGWTESTASTFVLDFPVKSPQVQVYKHSLTALQQLEYWKMFKINYTEHNPSVTISVGNTEWDSTAKWLYNNWPIVGGLSFLPQENNAYTLAPYETITEEEYHKTVSSLPALDFGNIMHYEREDSTTGAQELACVGGVCEL